MRVRILICILFMLGRSAFSQCYIVASEKHKQVMLREYGVVVEDRQGNFASFEECEAYLNSVLADDPVQRAEHHCECEHSINEQETVEQDQLNIPDRETQLDKIKRYEQLGVIEKKKRESESFNEKKKNITLKTNKALDQLNTTNELSRSGEQNVTVGQQETGRKESESSFSQGKLKLKGREDKNNIPVSPPAPVNEQKNLFDYIYRETNNIQVKLKDSRNERDQLLENKIKLQQKINDQNLKIVQLKRQKEEVKNENKPEDIDSLLMEASRMLEESEELSRQTDQYLEENKKTTEENEALLNKYQDAYNLSQQDPGKSGALLKELQGGKK